MRKTRSSGNEPVVIRAITLISQQAKDSYLTNLNRNVIFGGRLSPSNNHLRYSYIRNYLIIVSIICHIETLNEF